jgi:hypothetical protein
MTLSRSKAIFPKLFNESKIVIVPEATRVNTGESDISSYSRFLYATFIPHDESPIIYQNWSCGGKIDSSPAPKDSRHAEVPFRGSQVMALLLSVLPGKKAGNTERY